MGKLLLGVYVDLGKHIFDIIDSATGSLEGTCGIPFGGLITHFLIENGVKEKR